MCMKHSRISIAISTKVSPATQVKDDALPLRSCTVFVQQSFRVHTWDNRPEEERKGFQRGTDMRASLKARSQNSTIRRHASTAKCIHGGGALTTQRYLVDLNYHTTHVRSFVLR